MTGKLRFFSYALLALALLAVGAAAQSATVAQRKEKRIMDCTLESKSFDDCDMTAYVVRVVVFSIPGIIIAGFMLFACPMYCCGKYCCNCCGGRSQTPNFCCPNTELPARYSKGDIIRPKFLGLVCVALTAAAFTWGMIGAGTLVQGLTDFTDAIRDIPDLLTREVETIREALLVDTYSPTGVKSSVYLLDRPGAGNNTKQEAYGVRDEIKALIDSSLGEANTYIQQVSYALWALFIVPSVLIALGFMAALCNCRKYFPMTLVWLLFLVGVLVWLLHSVFSATSMIVGDFCAEVAGLAQKQLNLVAVLAQCDDSQFAVFKTAFRALEISEAEDTCWGIRKQCYLDNLQGATVLWNIERNRVYNCPEDLQCDGTTFAILVNMMETIFYIHADVATSVVAQATGFGCSDPANKLSCTIAKCATDCLEPGSTTQLSELGLISQSLYYSFLSAKKVSNTIDTLGARFSTCDSVFSIILSPFDPPCQAITDGLVYDRQATGLMGLCCIGGIFIFAWGAKRFISLDQAELAQTENKDAVEEM